MLLARARLVVALAALATWAGGCLKLDAKDGFPCSADRQCPSDYQCLTVNSKPGCYRAGSAGGNGGQTTGGAGGGAAGGHAGGAGGIAAGGRGGSAGAASGGSTGSGGTAGAAAGTGGTAGAAAGTGGAAGATGKGGAAGASAGGAGGGTITCNGSQHLCGSSCVSNTSTDQCGTSCLKCTAPTGGTAVCAEGACDFDCGTMKKCTVSMICVASNGCCDDTDCTANAGGQTGTCDTGSHMCNYTCTGNTQACTKAGTTTCITKGTCCNDTDCTGSCMQCNSSHACVPATNGPDPAGHCAGTCDSAGACKSKQGQTCSATTGGCVDGTTCVDNYCCNSACTGACQACDVSGHEGTCSGVPSGAPHGTTRTCGGCTGVSFVGPGTCSAGACGSTPAPQTCPGGNVCVANACGTSCSTDSDCAASYFCEGGTCHVDAAKIVSGAQHSCALLVDGTIRCWGSDASGQLGDGAGTASAKLVQPVNLGAATDIVAGAYQTCAILAADGSVWCWGWNYDGQLGNNVSTMVSGQPGSATPVKVTGFPPAGTQAVALAAAYYQTCAALSDGSVWCWGLDRDGELGTTVTTSCYSIATCSFAPVKVPGLSGTASKLAASYSNGWAVLSGGTVAGWGTSYWVGAGGADATPPISLPLSNVTALSGSTTNTLACAIAGGVAKCWGDDYYGSVGDGNFGDNSNVVSPANVQNPMGTSAQVTLISAGDTHACAAYSNNSIWCWGHNDQGQLGTATTSHVGGGLDPGSATPVRVSNIATTISGLAAGGFHTCALLGNGSVVCWGDNYLGDLGNGTTTPSTTPVSVVGW
jgi:alpha-tubulin suppressor-like RCC1 family protein